MRVGDSIGRGIAFSAATFACFSAADVAVKWLTAGYSVFQLACLTAVFATLPVAVLVWRGGRPVVLRPRRPGPVALRTLLLACDTLGAYFAFSRLPLADAYTLLFAAPLIVTALSPWLLRDAVGWHRWSAVIVGFAGVVVAMRPGGAALDLGYLAAIGSASAFSLALVITRRIGDRESAATLVVWTLIGKAAVAGTFMAFAFTPMPLVDLALVAFAGVFVGIAQIFMVLAFRQAPPAVVAPFQYTQMLWGVFYGFVFFGDVPDVFIIVGSGLVIASGLYILWREQVVRRRRRADATSDRVDESGHPPAERK